LRRFGSIRVTERLIDLSESHVFPKRTLGASYDIRRRTLLQSRHAALTGYITAPRMLS
jgi:hypothetical protein